MAINSAKLTRITTDTGLTTDFITSDNTLVFSGSVATGGGSPMGIWLAAGSGPMVLIGSVTPSGAATTWSYNYSATILADGNYTLTLTDGTAPGSRVLSSQALAIDTAAPAAPDVPMLSLASDSGAADGVTNVTTPTITGTGAEAGATVKLYEGTTLRGSTIANADGSWAITTSLGGGNGVMHSLTAKVTDAAGNTSAASGALNVTIDNRAPATLSRPTLTAGSDSGRSGTDYITNVAGPSFTGTAEKGSTVTLYDGSNVLGTAIADATSGLWTITAALTEGTHGITATAMDLAGNTSAVSTARSVTIDMTAPAAPSTPDMVATSDTGASNADNITRSTMPAFAGTAENGATVTLYDGATVLGTATASSTGVWRITPVAALADGKHTISAQATDAAGNPGIASSGIDIWIDTQKNPPSITGPALTNSKTPTITGKADVGATVTVSDGATKLGTTVADMTGTWSFTPVAALSNGLHNLTATQIDLAGNGVSTAAQFGVTVDLVPPVAPIVTLANDTGVPGDLITSDPSLTVDGIELGATVAYSLDGKTWSAVPTISEGLNTVQVRQTDAAGNQSAAASLSFTLDTQAPAAPVVSLAKDTGASGDDQITSDPGLALSGVEAGASVGYSLDGITWSATAPGVAALTQGLNTVQVRQTDAAGNQSAAASLSFTLDTQAPAAPGVSLAKDTGASGDDQITSDPGLALSNLEPDVTVEYSIDNGVTWSVAAPGVADLAQGANTVQVRQTDTAGNPSAPFSFTFTLDSVPPVAPGVALANDTGAGSYASDLRTSDPTLTVSGSEPNATVEYSTDDGATWSAAPAIAADGGYNVLVRQTDLAGNMSLSGALSFVLDTSADADANLAVLLPSH